jgi:hypothetical protein
MFDACYMQKVAINLKFLSYKEQNANTLVIWLPYKNITVLIDKKHKMKNMIKVIGQRVTFFTNNKKFW